jgi:hypothetical protein
MIGKILYSSCGSKSRWFRKHFWATCFLCANHFCKDCSIKLDTLKIPFVDMQLRSICSNCKTWFEDLQSKSWFGHAEILYSRHEISLSTFIAICNIAKSIEHGPEFCSQVDQTLAREMFASQNYFQLFGYQFCRCSKSQTKREILKLFVKSLILSLEETHDTSLSIKISLLEKLLSWISSENTKKLDVLLREEIIFATSKKLEFMKQNDHEFKENVVLLVSDLRDAILENSLQGVADILLDNYDDELLLVSSLKVLLNETDTAWSTRSKHCLEFCKTFLAIMTQGYKQGMKLFGEAFWNGFIDFQDNDDQAISLSEFVSLIATHKYAQRARTEMFKQIRQISFENFFHCLNIEEQNITNSPKAHNLGWENLNVPEANIKMFQKFEKSVNGLIEQGAWQPLDAGFAYYDFIIASSCQAQFLTTTLISAQWFAKAMESSENPAEKFACKKLIFQLTLLAGSLAFEFNMHPYIQYYVAEKICGLQFFACINAPYGSDPESEAKTLAEQVDWLVCSSRLCPIQSIPVSISSNESVIFDIISRKAHCDYIFALLQQEEDERQLSEGILRYQVFENHFSGNLKLN